jgi:chromosome segregation ATPase
MKDGTTNSNLEDADRYRQKYEIVSSEHEILKRANDALQIQFCYLKDKMEVMVNALAASNQEKQQLANELQQCKGKVQKFVQENHELRQQLGTNNSKRG